MDKIQAILNKLTLEQKAALTTGKNTWESKDIPGLLPAIFLSDGPHGLRKQVGSSDHLGINGSEPATCFPTAATLANSWDVTLMESVGRAIGTEARALDVDMVLGPGLNIKRNPRCGRNFEYFSEDPYLAGKLAAGEIRGIQDSGTMACPKHFAVNSQELRRMSSNSIVDDRTLHELYLTNFEIAVKEGQPEAIMTAYNQINGQYANEHPFLLQETLRENWGFTGLVVSDWGGDNNHLAAIEQGSQLAMPGLGQSEIEAVVEAVQAGTLSQASLDATVAIFIDNVLKHEEQKQSKKAIDWDDQHQLAFEAALKSIVLLKNEDHILPINNQQTVAIIGDFAQTPRYQGAGSSLVNAKKVDTILEKISDYSLDVVGFAQGFERGKARNAHLEDEAIALAKKAEIIVLFLGLDEVYESEGKDRMTIDLPENQCQLLQAIQEVSSNIVVCLSAGSVVDTSWEGNVKGIVHGYLGGQAGSGAMLEVLTGRYNPSGRLAETYPLRQQDVLFDEEFPAHTPDVFYKESLFVGYRYYDSCAVPVRYPFGYGLSYTSFEYQQLEVIDSGVHVSVKNTGTVAGVETIQLYIGKEQTNLLRPTKELKGFAKVCLEPGEEKTVFLPFEEWTFRFFDCESNSWQIERGEYTVSVGRNVFDCPLTAPVFKEGMTVSDENWEELPVEYRLKEWSKVTTSSFLQLARKPLVDLTSVEAGSGELHKNSTISDMSGAKNGLARVVASCFSKLIQRSEKKGKPDLNLLFLYNMPFRAIGKMTNGAVSQAMVESILVMVNGKFWRGIRQLMGAYHLLKKNQKRWRNEERKYNESKA